MYHERLRKLCLAEDATTQDKNVAALCSALRTLAKGRADFDAAQKILSVGFETNPPVW